MELALLLVVVVLLELALTVWLLARTYFGTKVAGVLTERMDGLERRLSVVERNQRMEKNIEPEPFNIEPVAQAAEIDDVMATASPEQLGKALQMLKRLGVDVEEG